MSDVGQMMIIRTSGFVAWGIRFFTQSEFNHTVNIVGDVTDAQGVFHPDAVVSAENSGVTIMPRSAFPTGIVSDFPMTEHQQLMAKAFSLNAVGAKYARLAFIMIWFTLVTKISPPKWVERYLASSKHYICSDLTDSAFHAAGIRLFKDVVPSAVYPGMFVPLYVDMGLLPEGSK
jgi:hypothetical protein